MGTKPGDSDGSIVIMEVSFALIAAPLCDSFAELLPDISSAGSFGGMAYLREDETPFVVVVPLPLLPFDSTVGDLSVAELLDSTESW